MTLSSLEDDDYCDLEAPRGGSCWDNNNFRSMRVRTSLLGRKVRRTLREAPGLWLALVIVTHATMMPLTMMGMSMLQPTAELRLSNDAFRENNEDTLQQIWQLVEAMHHGDDDARLLFGESMEELDMMDVKRALRTERAFEGMTRALLEALRDPYSQYGSPTTLSQNPVSDAYGLALQTPSEWVRRGGTLSAASGRTAGLFVSGIYPDSSAERAGLRAGDTIEHIDGVSEPLSGLSREAITSILRGEYAAATTAVESDGASAGGGLVPESGVRLTSLRLHVRRVASAAERPAQWISLAKSGGKAPLRSRVLADHIGYVRITAFTEDGTAALAQSMSTMRQEGCEGWVIDLRNNPGRQVRPHARAVAISPLSPRYS